MYRSAWRCTSYTSTLSQSRCQSTQQTPGETKTHAYSPTNLLGNPGNSSIPISSTVAIPMIACYTPTSQPTPSNPIHRQTITESHQHVKGKGEKAGRWNAPAVYDNAIKTRQRRQPSSEKPSSLRFGLAGWWRLYSLRLAGQGRLYMCEH